MSSRLYFRVTVGEDGRPTLFELMLDGLKIDELSEFEVYDFLIHTTSSLRQQKLDNQR